MTSEDILEMKNLGLLKFKDKWMFKKEEKSQTWNHEITESRSLRVFLFSNIEDLTFLINVSDIKVICACGIPTSNLQYILN